MAISVEEIVQIALGRFKENLELAIEPIVRRLDARIEKLVDEVRAQGASMVAGRRRDDEPEVVEAEVVGIGKSKR